MKLILKDKRRHVLRFDKNEDVLIELAKFAEAEKITAAYFSGIGASQSLILSYYDLKTKKYLDTEIEEAMEIVSLTGNVGLLEKKTVIHAHGVFSDEELQPIAGHVKKLVVSATCEVLLISLDGEIERELNQEIGLNLMKVASTSAKAAKETSKSAKQ